MWGDRPDLRWEDAEQDCTEALTRHPDNAKVSFPGVRS